MTARPVFRNVHLSGALGIAFLLPNALFASYLAAFPRLVLLAGCVACLVVVARREASSEGSFLGEPVSWGRFAACALLGIAILVLAGEGHLLFANWDWLFRDAVLADLSRSADLPRYMVDAQTFLLRAPLGMYLLPALAARLTTLAAGHAVLLAQNGFILAVILYVIGGLGGRRWPVVVVAFVAFSGLDIVSLCLWRVLGGRPLDPSSFPSQIENVVGFEYSSHITQLFWVPNHCLPGWWLAMMALLCLRREIALGELGLALAVSLLWSPLAVAGALPLGCACLFLRLRGALGDLRLWMSGAAALGFLPVAIYLTRDSGQVERGLLVGDAGFWVRAPAFLAFEIPQVVIVTWAWRTLAPSVRMLLPPVVATLILLPLFRLGTNNDLLMRGSIPALAVLGFAFAEVLAQGWKDQPVCFAAASLIALGGTVTPAFEMARPLLFPAYKVSDCNLLAARDQAGPTESLANYLARPEKMPGGLLRPERQADALTPQSAPCWPDFPFDPDLRVSRHSNRELLESERRRSGDAPK